MLTKVTQNKKTQWSKFIDTCVFAYNTSQQESTKYSPFELMFGRKATLPIDIDVERNNPDALVDSSAFLLYLASLPTDNSCLRKRRRIF